MTDDSGAGAGNRIAAGREMPLSWFGLPWESYVRQALERTWPLMRRYLDEWCHGWTGKDRDTCAHTLTTGLGDWLPPQAVPTINALVSSAFYARMGPDCGRDGTRFGPPREAQHYDVLFETIRRDFICST
jgi:Bacterial alpha-L-rhamnosidase 6 hairpin glycosidase domain